MYMLQWFGSTAAAAAAPTISPTTVELKDDNSYKPSGSKDQNYRALGPNYH